MELNGRCHCGEVAYEISGDPMGHMLCHCADCRRHAGAPLVGWALFHIDNVKTTRGRPKIYHSSEHGRRHFCGDCGTGLFYTNDDFLPGIIDVRTATLDDPEALPPECHMQTAERLGWTEKVHELPAFERFPPTA